MEVEIDKSMFANCPFCGGTDCDAIPQKFGIAVICYKCDAAGPSAYTKGEAVKLWNTRVFAGDQNAMRESN